MQKINRIASRILGNLIDRMEQSRSQIFRLDGFPDVLLEKLQINVSTREGQTDHYRLAQMLDHPGCKVPAPEMRFLVLPPTQAAPAWDLMGAFPCYYQEHSSNPPEQSVIIFAGQVQSFSLPLQRTHCAHAERWLFSLHQQGYLR